MSSFASSFTRLAATLAYWLAVLVVSALLVLALLWLLERRDASSLDGAAGSRTATASIVDREVR